MATYYQSGAWNSSSILAGYGLMSVIGPTEPTTQEMKRLNSRSGGEHAGHGNWMQTFNPRPSVKSTKPAKMYDYGHQNGIVTQSRLPGLSSRKVPMFKGKSSKTGPLKGPKKQNVIINLAPAMDTEGGQKPEVKDDLLEKNEDVVMEPQSPDEPLSAAKTPISPIPERFVPQIAIGPQPIKPTTILSPQDNNIINAIYGKKEALIPKGRNIFGLNVNTAGIKSPTSPQDVEMISPENALPAKKGRRGYGLKSSSSSSSSSSPQDIEMKSS